jgi:carbon monoxide dehydrogenase subunit G
MGKFIHHDVMQLDVAPEQVREFVMTPERIADYFPGVIDYGTFEAGKSIWCSSKSGVSLLQLIEEETTQWKLTMRVVNASKIAAPYTIENIENNPFMSMVEDWEIEASDGGTRLTKTWRNIVMHKMKWLPIGFLIRRTAKSEHQKLVDSWNKASEKTL